MTSLKPLAERMRPTSLEHYFGQSHLVGAQGILRPMLEREGCARSAGAHPE